MDDGRGQPSLPAQPVTVLRVDQLGMHHLDRDGPPVGQPVRRVHHPCRTRTQRLRQAVARYFDDHGSHTNPHSPDPEGILLPAGPGVPAVPLPPVPCCRNAFRSPGWSSTLRSGDSSCPTARPSGSSAASSTTGSSSRASASAWLSSRCRIGSSSSSAAIRSIRRPAFRTRARRLTGWAGALPAIADRRRSRARPSRRARSDRTTARRPARGCRGCAGDARPSPAAGSDRGPRRSRRSRRRPCGTHPPPGRAPVVMLFTGSAYPLSTPIAISDDTA